MDKSRILELIKLEAIGCLKENDRESLRSIKETEEDFPWGDLAEYQNVVVCLPVLLDDDAPPPTTKDKMIGKLNDLIYHKEIVNEVDENVLEAEVLSDNNPEKPITKSKFDWGSLSVLDSSPIDEYTSEKAELKKTEEKEKPIASSQFTKVSQDEEDLKNFQEYPEVGSENIPPNRNQFGKYILILAILFIISGLALAYFIMNKEPAIIETSEKNNKSMSTIPTTTEKLINDDVQELVSEGNIQKPVIEIKQNNTENKQEILPKAPPKIPDSIDEPLVKSIENTMTDYTKLEEKDVIPPPQETIENIDEPAYFVAVEEMPEPLGGLSEIQRKIKYPQLAKVVGIEGKVLVRAFVDEAGIVTNAQIIKGIGGGCDEAAMDAILKTKFKPGKQRGRPVKVQVTLPIVFRL